MHRKEGRAGQRGSLFERPDAAGREAGPLRQRMPVNAPVSGARCRRSKVNPEGGWQRGGSDSASLRAGATQSVASGGGRS